VNNPTIYVKAADALDFNSDVLILKYAQAYYGVDDIAAQRLKSRSHNYPAIAPSPGDHVLLPSKGQVVARNVLFVGVPELYRLGYPEIREFAIRSIQILADELPEVEEVSMTMHGVGYGLDEREAFLAQIGGLLEAFESNWAPKHLERVTIVETDVRRVGRLRRILKTNLPLKFVAATSHKRRSFSPKQVMEDGVRDKPHVFVAMPFGEEMEDVYIFGIQGPTNAAGYLCERVDMTAFTGDILSRIKVRIETASLVIADMTGGNANVYLEVGYAWGKDRPTLLVARKGEDLKFDVQNQRCIIYKNINDLAKNLEKDLATLGRQSP
jgi:hypothetical protein